MVQQIEAELARDEIVTDFAAFVGVPAPRVYYSFAPEFPRPSYGMLLVGTPSPEATVERVAHYQAALQGRFPGARINVNSFQQGIPVDAPVEVRLVGPAVDQLRELADQVKAKLVEIPGAQQVRDDFLDGFSLDLDLNMELANREGFTSGSIAQQLMVGFAGVPITEIWEGETSLPLVLRLADPSRANFSALEELMVRSPFGVSHVPLHQLVSFDPVWSPSQIARRNGARTLTVRANPADGVLPSEVLGQLRPALAELDLPPGYFIEIGGEYEGQVETFGEMAGALAASVALIYFVLLFQFRRSGKVALVMVAIPLTFFGAMLGLVITGNPLGFTAAVGLISLVGIVIRNSILLVDHADELQREHTDWSVSDCAIASGQRRLRPIFLTSMAAAVGVLPMILSGSPLWAPLASVFSVGIIWSMVMTLLIVPAAYARFIRPLAVEPEPTELPPA